MTLYKKKIAVFLVAVALSSVADLRFAICDFRFTKAAIGSQQSAIVGDPNVSVGSAGSADTRELFFKMMFAVLLVVVLGTAAIYVSKKFLPKITNLPGKKIRVVETVYLGSRKQVHLLKIHEQYLLIGSTSEGVTMLADVTDTLADLTPREAGNN
ncbi:MAG: hypothetical protein DRP62_02515 [Planctomycetota bacterium]|nr:MAG: hypothetical protein DRP62_02515 [Planctomycetota bacterium]